MTADRFKYCPGLIHLRAQLRKLIKAQPDVAEIITNGYGDPDTWPITEEGIIRAALQSTEVDGMVRYCVGRAVLIVIYDGPYSDDSAAEIINDCNTIAEEILDAE